MRCLKCLLLSKFHICFAVILSFQGTEFILSVGSFSKKTFKEALKATTEHRGSTEQISDVKGILQQISESNDLKDMWRKYQKKFAYASDISYENVLEALKKIMDI